MKPGCGGGTRDRRPQTRARGSRAETGHLRPGGQEALGFREGGEWASSFIFACALSEGPPIAQKPTAAICCVGKSDK